MTKQLITPTRRAVLGGLAALPAAAIAAPAIGHTPDRSAWERAASTYRESVPAFADHPASHASVDDPGYHRLIADQNVAYRRYCAASRRLFATPAPDAAALVEKAEIYLHELENAGIEEENEGREFNGILADIRRLAAS
jgi:hypothetical protein